MVPISVRGRGRSIRTFALLDDGSTITLIEEGLARSVGARGNKVDLTLRTVQGDLTTSACEKVNLEIFGASGKFEIRGAMTIKELPLPPQSVPKHLLRRLSRVTKGLDIEPYYDARARVLIGQDNWRLLVTREIIEVVDPDLALSLTPLGWVIHGVTCAARDKTPRLTCALLGDERMSAREGIRGHVANPDAVGEHVEEPLDRLMREYFGIDSLGASYQKVRKTEHDRALAILKITSRKVDGAWETGLLWKEELSPSSNSLLTARKRLSLLEKRLDRDPNYANLYYSEMQRFISLGYAEKVELANERPRTWYLPHFGVVNVNKPGKIRLVFDAAAKTGGVSLNDQLEAGPDLLQPLPAILLRFRRYKIAYKGDISDMFLRIKVRPQDRGAQRFLWRGRDRNAEPDVYEMSSLIFGAKSSPCNAIYIKDENARLFYESRPEAARSIVRDSYMDDYLGSSKSEAEAIAQVRGVIEINKSANFEMHSWASNAAAVLQATAILGVHPRKSKPQLASMIEEAREFSVSFGT